MQTKRKKANGVVCGKEKDQLRRVVCFNWSLLYAGGKKFECSTGLDRASGGLREFQEAAEACEY